MDFLLSKEQRELKALSRKIAQEKILPKREYYDETEDFPWEVVKHLTSAGLFEVYIPEMYGGKGGGVTELCIVTEELSRICGGTALAYAGTALGSYPILLFGNADQKIKYLPSIAKGEKLAAFGLTEANAGSDVSAIQTQAKPMEDGYILNGTKQWITNGGEAEIYTIIAVTDKTKGARGASAFIIEKGFKGFSFEKKRRRWG